MYEVQKRDGKIAEFDIAKISSAIAKAFDALGKQYHPSTIDLLALNVTAHFEPKIEDGIIAVEDVQDSVEEVLSDRRATPTWPRPTSSTASSARRCATSSATLLDYKDAGGPATSRSSDWRVKENSTVTYSVGGLILSNSGAITANYWLSEIYDEEIAQRPPQRRHPPARPVHAHRLLRGLVASSSSSRRAWAACPARSPPPRPATCPPCATRWSTSWASCRTSGPAPRRSPRFDTYLAPFVEGGQPHLQRGQAVHPVLRLRREHALAAGARRRRSPTSRSTGPCPADLRGPAGHRGRQGAWTSPTATARPRWTW